MTDDATTAGGRVESLLVGSERIGSRLGAVATMAVLVAAFGLAAGPLGAAAGVTTALVWFVVGTPYAIAIGHVLIVALDPGGIDPATVAIVEAGFLVLLLAPALRTDAPVRALAGTIGSVAVLGGLAWAAVSSQSLWVAAGLTVGGLALASYGLYRYGLVTLGLVDDAEPERPAETTTNA